MSGGGSNFGELVLVLGDLHVPGRVSKIPVEFQRMLVPNKMQHCICTGNLSQDDYEMFRNLVPNLHVVAGEYDSSMDDGNGGTYYPGVVTSQMPVFPETRVVQVGAFRIGVVHGHQIIPWGDPMVLAKWKRRLQCDILITGHTHTNQITLEQNRGETFYHINPGSITGAYSPLAATASPTDPVTPSFILLAVQDTKIVCYMYELNAATGEVDVSKTEINKHQLIRETEEQVSNANNPQLLQSLLA